MEPRVQKPIPEVLYHVTSVEHLNSILAEGLIPQKAPGAGGGEDEIVGVYLTTDYQALIEIDPDLRYLFKELVVIRVQGKNLSLIPDTAYDFPEGLFTEEDKAEGMYDQFAYISPKAIPPEEILGYTPPDEASW